MKPAIFLILATASLAHAAPLVTDGLVAAFDASEQPAARRAASLPPVGAGRPVERLLGSEGTALVAVQPVASARPVFHAADRDGGPAFLRFDGKDDALVVHGGRRLTPQMTVFVLAAPAGNPGGFSALFATGEASQNDYTSGLNVDFGPAPTPQLSALNLETAGASGFRDFLEPGKNLAADLPFGAFHVFTVRSKIGEKGNDVFLDGVRLGERTRLESNLGLDEMALGARLCSNDPGMPPFLQGFFQGDLAAVLVYDRALSDAEREKVEQALFDRTPALNALASGEMGHALQTVADPPVVQMLVPGFAVDELPVKLTNLTSIRHRHDGKLVALGYDGRIHLLTDSDGDGREDTASIFWDRSVIRGPIGMVPLPAGDPRGDGVFVASKGRVSLIVDRDRDGRGDEEMTVATGWKENFTNVDATGLAVDPKDGSIYFCLGVENFADAYLRDAATGKSAFRITTDRGTIQRVSADFARRETVCTGVRFACALAFNEAGDLFATEQEGATWLPNGNPLDELLHIVPGRHYGFPPRHPKHLPDVIDEPAVMEYGPQHQSTVGMVFNEPVNGGPVFGPAAWKGDALICGESRGKLYRTRLVKTDAGYVAQNQIIACLGMLTVDACVSPRGDLIVACHTGPPDWGTGPAGEGRLFRIRHVGRETPQPVLAWAAAPDEFRVAFDRPLQPAEWAAARGRVRIEAGRHVAAGDRFEVIRPGYQVVRDQMAAPRRWVPVRGLSLTADARTLVLRVPRQVEDTGYAVTLPVPESWRAQSAIAQRPEMDLALTLNGVRVDGTVLPHPDLAVAAAFTRGSAEHEAFLAEARFSSRLVQEGKIDAGNIFQPAVQPGASLDWDVAADAFAQRRMEVRAPSGKVTLSPADGRLSSFTAAGPALTFALDDRVRPVPLHRLFVPWAVSGHAPADAAAGPRTDVAGNWLHGRRLFFGEAACFTCHRIRGEGTAFGPDLTNLVFRDRGSVLHDILQPSATLNPEQTGSTVTFADGSSVSGLVRTLDAERIVLGLPAGVEMVRPRAEVRTVEPMKGSLMPEGYAERLTAAQQEDLLTFLLTTPLEPAPVTRLDPAPPLARPLAEVAPFLEPPPAGAPPLRILLSAGAKDHGLNEHDYPLWQQRWATLLALADGVTVSTCTGFPTRGQLAAADVVVLYSSNPGWDLKAASVLDEYQRRGGGVVTLHWAMEGRELGRELAERIGLATSMSAYRHGPLELAFTERDHPISRGFTTLRLLDESYWKYQGDPAKISVLATQVEENRPQTQLWTMEKGPARVFGCVPGHYTWTFDDPLYRVLVLRGIAWAAHQDTRRLLELSTVGARFAP